ncbi:putative baseplate assembly protein [Planosporangium sp. 12N6]|uniref:putative baseplate assembly protein n=1 Tax=Planosporangium spinosum TaxID=3402278 RepID=UPI003CF47580
MALPAPDLDDRRFQDLVDDAKRMVMRRCPEWTDHNVSDPGVTLIETFAYLTDQVLYRLNQVPDRLYLKFLDLIGVELLPPVAAVAPVTFWLSAPASAPLTVAAGTNVATERTERTGSLVFSTVADLPILPCALSAVRTRGGGADAAGTDRTEDLRMGRPFPAFTDCPQPGDLMQLGLSDPVPGCAVRLDFRGRVEGVGVDPEWPPLAWEAWDGQDWVACEVSTDSTGGLNRSGEIIVHLPAGHTASVVDGVRAGWLRARVLATEPHQRPYSATPVIDALAACTVGGTVDAVHAEIVENEVLGVAEGVAGQRFTLSRTPVLGGAAPVLLEVSSADGWQAWQRRDTFADSGPDDRHYVLDASTGTVRFGPAVRLADGGLRQYGAAPERDAVVRMTRYSVGGGTDGNVGAGAIRTLKSSIPFVAGVRNLRRARGGADGETLDQARDRGPILLRTRSRAVTAEDYEAISCEAAPEVARVRCLTAGEDDIAPGTVRVLVVPAAAAEDGQVAFGALVPSQDTLRRVAQRLDEVRLVGTRVHVEPPLYRGVTVVARLLARPRTSTARIEAEALAALHRFLNPLTGGPDGTGWPFGRPVQVGEVFAVLQRVRGVELVEDVRLFGANPVTGERGAETARLDLPPDSLVFSYQHLVRVEQQ